MMDAYEKLCINITFPFCVNSIALKATMNDFLTNSENDIKETEKDYKGKDMVNGLARY